MKPGRLDIEAVDFRLDDVIASVTSITAQKAQDKGLEFLVDVADSVPQTLVGDSCCSIELCTANTARVVSSSEAGNRSSLSVPLPSSERPSPNCDEQ